MNFPTKALLIAFALFLAFQDTTSTPCDEVFSQLENKTLDPSFFIKYSGKTLNDLGNPTDCSKTPNVTFHALKINYQIPTYLGVCFDSRCSPQELKPKLHDLVAAYNITQIPPNFEEKIIFIDKFEDYKDESKWLYILTLVIFAILVSLTLVEPLFMKPDDPANPPKRRSTFKVVASCFNLVKNIEKAFTIKTNNPDLGILSGIRVLAFIQVVWGHEWYLHVVFDTNPQDLFYVNNESLILWILGCLLSVDTFFWLGGFLVAYVVCDPKQLSKFSFTRPVFAIAGLIHRIARIMPCYIIALLVWWKVIPYIGSGALWMEQVHQSNACDSLWYKKLLFIDIFDENGQSCFGWGWYISNDIWLFILCIILLMVYSHNKSVGKICVLLTIFQLITFASAIIFRGNYKVPFNFLELTDPKLFNDFYVKPWTRGPVYIIGLYFGILYREFYNEKDLHDSQKAAFLSKLQISLKKCPSVRYLFIIFGLLLCWFILFEPQVLQEKGQTYWSNIFQNYWMVYMRSVFVIGLSFICVPSFLGFQDIFSKFFSSYFFALIARFSFTGYLLHYSIIRINVFSRPQAQAVLLQPINRVFLTDFVLTLIFAVILSLIAELPLMALENSLTGRKKEAPPVKKESLETSELLKNEQGLDGSYIEKVKQYQEVSVGIEK